MLKRVAVLPGDGIGPEIMRGAVAVLRHVLRDSAVQLEFTEGLIGGAAWDQYGDHFPTVTRELCSSVDAILFGAVGGPVAEAHLRKWQNCEVNALLGVRKLFNFNVNIRPVQVHKDLIDLSPLRARIIQDGIDVVIFRELSSDIYFGDHRRFMEDGKRKATDTATYGEDEVRAIAEKAFDAAENRKKRVVSVDKANVLETSRLWREVVQEVARCHPDVEFENMLVDSCAMKLAQDPAQFDVIVTSNLFGDILSDLAAAIPGSLGLLASASLNSDGFGMFEPPSGSAPEIAGKDCANPVGQILSAALMLRYAFRLEREASEIEQGVDATLQDGIRTRDIAGGDGRAVTCSQMTQEIIRRLR